MISIATADLLTDHIQLLVQQGHTRIIIDGTGLAFVDSTGLRALLQAHREVHAGGSGFFVVPSDALSRLLEITAVSDIFRVFPTVRKAAAVMRAEAP